MYQEAFRFGPFSVRWYGILVVSGFVLGLWTASRRAPRDRFAGELVADLGPWLMVGAIVGARLVHVVSYWRVEFAGRPWWEPFMIHHGGLVFYGGLLGASLVTVWFARARGVPLWRLADTLAPSIALGQAVGRVGCLVNGCCYGLPTALPWGLHYPADHATCGVAVHPVQAYEALLDLGLYAALEWRHRHKRFDGQVFALYLIAYALLRGGVEFLRGDYEEKHLGGWATPAQLVGAILLPAGIWLWRRQSGRLRSG